MGKIVPRVQRAVALAKLVYIEFITKLDWQSVESLLFTISFSSNMTSIQLQFFIIYEGTR